MYKIPNDAYEKVSQMIRAAEWSGNQKHMMDLERNFNDIVKAAYGLEDHPKADKALSVAYQFGHSYGLNETLNYFSDIVEILED